MTERKLCVHRVSAVFFGFGFGCGPPRLPYRRFPIGQIPELRKPAQARGSAALPSPHRIGRGGRGEGPPLSLYARIPPQCRSILPFAMSPQPDNISAGTQVVSLVEVRGTNNSLVHPRGAVGVVTRTPTGDQDQFLVRFPDGFEASFSREKLEVLKHFKDRLGQRSAGVPPASSGSVPAPSSSARDSKQGCFDNPQAGSPR